MTHHRTSRSPFLVLVVLGILLAATQASATLWVRVADEALVRQVVDRSGLIVQVEAANRSPAYTARIPSTDQRMLVQRVIHGELSEETSELTVRWRGGETSDGLWLKVQGVHPLPLSASALLFLKPGEDGTYDALHLFQGVFEIVRHEGRDYAYRSLGGTELSLAGEILSPAGDKRFGESERSRDLETFSRWIRAIAAGKAPAQTYWRDVSVDTLRAAAAAQRSAEKFTLFGAPFRWIQFDSGSSVSLRAHQAGQEGLAGGGFAEFRAAIGAWKNDAGSKVRYAYAGKTGATGGFDHADGVNAILFNDLNGAGGFDEQFSCIQGGVIATGGGYVAPNNHTHQGQVFGRIVEADIITNKNTRCILGTPATAREVFAHELGHTLGLGHSCGGESVSCAGKPVLNDAQMRATAHVDGRGARLNSDDRAGINFLYPAAAAVPPAAPTGLSVSSGGGGVVNLSWNDNATSETGFAIERRTSETSFAQVATVSVNRGSYQDGEPPTGSTVTYRVRAFNGAGNSGYSNNATVNTTGPAPPSNLTVVALSPHMLQLDWTDNTLDETAFEIQIRRQPGDNFVFATLADTDPNQTQQVFDELFTGSSFQFRVRAVTGAGNSSWSQSVTGDTPPYVVGEACVDSASTLCLTGGRYQNRVLWSEFAGTAGLGQRVVSEQTTNSGLFWFFGSDNWEMLVKNLDGCGINQSFWVFSAATTNVEYTLQVVDTWTGDAVTYYNPLGTAAPAVTDIGAFPEACGITAPFSAGVSLATEKSTGNDTVHNTDKSHGCTLAGTGTDTKLFLDGDRFEVNVDWRDFQDHSGSGKLVPFCSDNSGLFWFFGPNNWELLVKIIDACSFNERFWVFSAATTNVEYTLRVTDTQSGQTRTYFNPLGQASDAITDTDAFAACP